MLFPHVLGAIGVFLALTVDGVLVARLGRARKDPEFIECLGPFSRPLLGAPATVLVLVSGVYFATSASRSLAPPTLRPRQG